MRVAVVGATGNVGTALLRALDRSDAIESVVAVARRLPHAADQRALSAKAEWHAADIGTDPIDMIDGADAVVHLAWMIQPSHDEAVMRATNIDGTRRLIDATVSHRVPRLVYASSVGTYAPADKAARHDESWPTTGVDTSTYSRHKAAVEEMLDRCEHEHPTLQVVRMRTSLVFQRSAASEIHRLFLGPLVPWHLPRPLRVVPDVSSLTFQVTHADDIADSYVRALTRDVSGAFNVAAEPPLDPHQIAEAIGGRVLPVSRSVLRTAAALTYAARLQRSEPGWLDMAVQTPIMDCTRARRELEWEPRVSAVDALVEVLDGISDGAGDRSPPLKPR